MKIIVVPKTMAISIQLTSIKSQFKILWGFNSKKRMGNREYIETFFSTHILTISLKITNYGCNLLGVLF